MKKTILIGLAAATMLAGCNRDEVIEINQENAISFEDSFVNASTKATDATVDNLNKIYVYAMFSTTIGEAAGLTYSMPFDNTEVTKGGSSWTYSPLKYWFKGNYDFRAVNINKETSQSKFTFTPGVDAEFTANSTIRFVNDADSGYNGEQDLIYASATRTITDPTNRMETAAVPFTFNHLLSKAKFTITNMMGEGYKIQVKGLSITDAATAATITLNDPMNNGWAEGEGTFALAFNNLTIPGTVAESANKIASNEKYFIPKTGYTVSFTVDVLEGATVVNSKTFTATGVTVFKPGYSYNFTTDIDNTDFDSNAIQFTVEEVSGFTPDQDTPITIQ